MAGNIDFFNKSVTPKEIQKQKPFFSVNLRDKKELLKWLKVEVQNREELGKDFFKQCKINLLAYRGDYYGKSDRRQTDNLESVPARKTSKYCVNYLNEMTENLVSRMTRIKPAVEVNPANDEFEDKNSAKSVDLLVKHLWYINDIDLLLQNLHRHKYIFGETYVKIDWNEELGDLHPDYVLLRENASKMEEIPNEIQKLLEKPIYTGDVEYKHMLPMDVLLENIPTWQENKSIILKSVKHIDELKKEYPEQAKKIEQNAKFTKQMFSLSSFRNEPVADHLTVYTLYHKHDKFFPKGKKIVFISSMILEMGDLGFSDGNIPILRITDRDIPGMLRGMSRYKQALLLQNAHNNLSSSILKNEYLMAAPKWVVPKGAAKIEQFNNGRTILQYQGPVAPQLVQMNPTSNTTFNFRSAIEGEIGQMMQVGPISRGENPKPVTAAVALQFLNEQETERSISDIAKHNNLITELAKRSISVAGDYYKPDDGRMLRILGKENKYMIKFFDAANLHKNYDIRIQNSSAFPQSKAARLDRVLQTMQYASHLFPAERWAELLEFGSVEKMHTLITEAINSAESQVEDILEGNIVSPPEEYEDLIIHLRVYYKALQKRSFKEEVPPERREALKLHVEAVEMLAQERAKLNPLFASKLTQLEMFPVFYKLEGGVPLAGIPQEGQEPDNLPTEEVTKKGE